MVCIIFEAQSRLNFAANVRNGKNVGFLLKHKSKNDNEARKRVRGSSINDESKERESRREASRGSQVRQA